MASGRPPTATVLTSPVRVSMTLTSCDSESETTTFEPSREVAMLHGPAPT